VGVFAPMCVAISVHSLRFWRSAWTINDVGEWVWTRRSVSARSSDNVRPWQMTRAPCSAAAIAVALPIPLLVPVISMVKPWRSIGYFGGVIWQSSGAYQILMLTVLARFEWFG
jgi:hypothetical protein